MTLNLLLTSKSKSAKSKWRYEQLQAPSWLVLLTHGKSMIGGRESDIDGTAAPSPQLSDFWLNDGADKTRFCFEMKDHLVLPWPTDPDLHRITYIEYPMYYQRLRDLRCYMDARQPNGLRALWRDKRNLERILHLLACSHLRWTRHSARHLCVGCSDYTSMGPGAIIALVAVSKGISLFSRWQPCHSRYALI